MPDSLPPAPGASPPPNDQPSRWRWLWWMLGVGVLGGCVAFLLLKKTERIEPRIPPPSVASAAPTPDQREQQAAREQAMQEQRERAAREQQAMREERERSEQREQAARQRAMEEQQRREHQRPQTKGIELPELPEKSPEATPAPSALVDQELSRLERGSLAFNAPPTLVLRQTQRVQLLIQPGAEPADLAARLTAPGPIVTDTVAVSRVMEATLAGGPAFHIDDQGAPREQAVGASEPTQWQWLVTPLEPGAHQLHLTVNALVAVGGVERRKVLATRDYNIDVQVPAPAPVPPQAVLA